LRNFNEQSFRAVQERTRAFRPAARLEIPFDRLDAVAMADAGIGKQTRKGFELLVAMRQDAARSLQNLLLVELMWRYRRRQRHERGRLIHIAVPA